MLALHLLSVFVQAGVRRTPLWDLWPSAQLRRVAWLVARLSTVCRSYWKEKLLPCAKDGLLTAAAAAAEAQAASEEAAAVALAREEVSAALELAGLLCVAVALDSWRIHMRTLLLRAWADAMSSKQARGPAVCGCVSIYVPCRTAPRETVCYVWLRCAGGGERKGRTG